MKYKILILSGLSKATSNILKSGVSLAEIVDADIHFLYVKKPTEVVENENQLSAMRTINKEYLSTNNIIKDLIKPISENNNVTINHSFTIGNLKNEIGKYMDENRPDIIVLGKRKSKALKFMGDNITQFILKKHKGSIVIVNDNEILEPNKELHIGLFNKTKPNCEFTDSIIQATRNPVRSFKIAENTHSVKEGYGKTNKEYVFAKGDNVIKDISNYLSKRKINLLLVDRRKENLMNTNIKDIINTIDCSLLIINK